MSAVAQAGGTLTLWLLAPPVEVGLWQGFSFSWIPQSLPDGLKTHSQAGLDLGEAQFWDRGGDGDGLSASVPSAAWAQPTPSCPGPWAVLAHFSPMLGGEVGSLPAYQLNCGVCDKCPQLTLLVTFNPLFAASRSTKQPPGTSRRYSVSGVS